MKTLLASAALLLASLLPVSAGAPNDMDEKTMWGMWCLLMKPSVDKLNASL